MSKTIHNLLKQPLQAVAIASIVSLGVFVSRSTSAQNQEQASTNGDFNAWAKQAREQCEALGQAPIQLEEAVLERLGRVEWISEETVLSAVQAWLFYEGQRKPVAMDYPETSRMIDALMGESRNQPLLRIKLLQMKAHVLSLQGGRDGEAIKSLDEASAMLQEINEGHQVLLMELQTTAGEELLLANRRIEADARFLKAMSHSWFVADNPMHLRFGRELYLRAARGLIEVRKGDATALDEIFFVPAVRKELEPLLLAAKEAAKDK